MTWDDFFYYGKKNIKDENASDLKQLLMQPKYSLFYNRGYGVDHKHNFPQGFFTSVFVAFSIVSAVSKRNEKVSDGSGDYSDRRIAVSQDYISIVDTASGSRDIKVTYLNYCSELRPGSISVPVV